MTPQVTTPLHRRYNDEENDARADVGGISDSSPQQHTNNGAYHRQPKLLLPISWTLSLLVLIDMLAVSLVVPLLFQYYKSAGVDKANQRELLSSLYNISQILGGVGLSVVKDVFDVQGRTLLLVSFMGSALSYGMIAYSSMLSDSNSDASSSINWGLWILMASRVIVGFVKQTMTVTSTILTSTTAKQDRAKCMGRLTAASTIAWIVGPSTGALLYKYIHPKAPALLASGLFVLNIILITAFLPANYRGIETSSSFDYNDSKEIQKKSPLSRMMSNLKVAFSSRELAMVLVARLVFGFVLRATSYSQLGSFYEDMYQLQSHHRGFISSYQQLLQFAVQAFLVHPILLLFGTHSERIVTCMLCFGIAATDFLQAALPYLPFYLTIVIPIASLSLAMIKTSLQTLTSHVAPQDAVFSVFAGLDILQNLTGVAVPVYRTILFRFLAKDVEGHAFQGDPDPISWVISSGVHWASAATLISVLLLWRISAGRNHAEKIQPKVL